MLSLTPAKARQLWLALMGNATDLVTDAQALDTIGSAARARSLAIAAQEEIGRAHIISSRFATSWSDGSDVPRDVPEPRQLPHAHLQAFRQLLADLPHFWGDDIALDESVESASDAADPSLHSVNPVDDAEAAVTAQRRGWYVDIEPGSMAITIPTELDAGDAHAMISDTAKVIEMLLISDHTRQKSAESPYVSTSDLQVRLLPVAHPEMVAHLDAQREEPAEASELSPRTVRAMARTLEGLGLPLWHPEALAQHRTFALTDVVQSMNEEGAHAFGYTFSFDQEMIYEENDYPEFIRGLASALERTNRLTDVSSQFHADSDRITVRYTFDGTAQELTVEQRNDGIPDDALERIIDDLGMVEGRALLADHDGHGGFLVWVHDDMVDTFLHLHPDFTRW